MAFLEREPFGFRAAERQPTPGVPRDHGSPEKTPGARGMLRRPFSFSTYTGMVPSPAVLRPFGISAVTLAKNEEEWVETSILSILETVDELVVADHESEDDTPEILRDLAERLPRKIRLVSSEGRDFPSAVNLTIAQTRYRWILRWHADFVARAS